MSLTDSGESGTPNIIVYNLQNQVVERCSINVATFNKQQWFNVHLKAEFSMQATNGQCNVLIKGKYIFF